MPVGNLAAEIKVLIPQEVEVAIPDPVRPSNYLLPAHGKRPSKFIDSALEIFARRIKRASVARTKVPQEIFGLTA
jgi:hypothetical protein